MAEISSDLLRHLVDSEPGAALDALDQLEALHNAKCLQLAFVEHLGTGDRWGVAHVGEQPAALVSALIRLARFGAATRDFAATYPGRAIESAVQELYARLRRA